MRFQRNDDNSVVIILTPNEIFFLNIASKEYLEKHKKSLEKNAPDLFEFLDRLCNFVTANDYDITGANYGFHTHPLGFCHDYTPVGSGYTEEEINEIYEDAGYEKPYK